MPAFGVQAANYPCSGSNCGVAGCRGATFLCNDGSVSASKKSRSMDTGGAVGLLEGTATPMTPAVGVGACSCRSGHYCTGPHGGRFCMTDQGSESYFRE
ncbi:hypothetical protein E2F50_19420 [Rhizobium deserti]|uniref:Uncharacterized protein n=1 Tax=Rhizobium deserti TaxID=2547961 RepID=A0A4R5UAR0_9HYPH|nr:hypothetical protein E2F50_19420 [Rhizobium deserti]